MKKAFVFSLMLSGWLCLIHMANVMLDGGLNQYGIQPRVISSLPGIVFSPFLHGSFNHLLSNLSILFVLSFLAVLRGERYFVSRSAAIILLTGVTVWLFARPAIHIGASGWVFGLWSYLIARAWFRRRFTDFAIAACVVVLYGGLIWGVLPRSGFISWESHLFGAMSGILVAAFKKGRK